MDHRVEVEEEEMRRGRWWGEEKGGGRARSKNARKIEEK